MSETFKFIDLFAGMGGIRLGFEQACDSLGVKSECVLTSEIKSHAIKALNHNFPSHNLQGDIREINEEDMPDFDFLFAGFPCQPFSTGGKRQGFADTRGTLFFEIERVLRAKRPTGFILENVEGLVKHDLEKPTGSVGRTLKTILFVLQDELGYEVSWKVLDSAEFGVPQSRKRIFIIGTRAHKIPLDNFPKNQKVLRDVLETGLPPLDTDFTRKLLQKYPVSELHGKSIKDKRGGENNIHSWDIGLRGDCSEEQIILLNKLFKERRKKHWAKEIGITWMDGMPLTLSQISTFYKHPTISSQKYLKTMLDDLVAKEYLRFEHPKELVTENSENGSVRVRKYDETKPKGYNIVTGKLSFEINKILDPEDITPTLVATDMSKLAVCDGDGVRRLTVREGLRLSGFPEWYQLPQSQIDQNKAFDLLGNTVVVSVVQALSSRIITTLLGREESNTVSAPEQRATELNQLEISF